MSVQLRPPPRRRVERALEALFREARVLERRRRRRQAMLGLLASTVVAAVAYLVVWVSGGSVAARAGSPASVAGRGAARTARYSEYPFGALSVAASGVLYYVDREYGQIDEATRRGSRIVLSSLRGTATTGGSISGLGGLFVTKRFLWFTAMGGLYTATLAGRDVHRVGSAGGAIDLDVLPGGVVVYTTASGVDERTSDGSIVRLAGGGSIPFHEQSLGGHKATALADIDPVSVLATAPGTFYFVNEDNLYLVQGGEASMLRPLAHFFNGELAAGPSGALYGICGWSVCRITGHAFTPLFRLSTKINRSFAAPVALAVSPSGIFYISYSSQSTPTTHAGIVEFSATGRIIRVVASRTT